MATCPTRSRSWRSRWYADLVWPVFIRTDILQFGIFEFRGSFCLVFVLTSYVLPFCGSGRLLVATAGFAPKLLTLREPPPAHPKTATLAKSIDYRDLSASFPTTMHEVLL